MILDIEERITDPVIVLSRWKSECYSKYSFHTKEALTNGRKAKTLTFAALICSSTAGISSFVEKIQILTYLLGSLAIVSSIIQSLSKYLRYDILENHHKSMAIKYKILGDEILLNLSIMDNIEIIGFSELIKIKFDNLLKGSVK